MPPSRPRDPNEPESEPIEDRSEDRRTLEVRGGIYSVPMDVVEHEETPSLLDERDTMPPPLPVAEYVQTMMQQAETDDAVEAEPPPSRSPVSWRGEPPLSYRTRPATDFTPTLTGTPLEELDATVPFDVSQG